MIEFAANILMKELQYISSKDILERDVQFHSVPIRLLQQICFHTDRNADETDLLRKLYYLKEWVESGLRQEEDWKIDSKERACGSEEGIGVFDLLHYLISKILVSSQGKIVYRYKFLEVWHLISGKLGTDLFTASAYAHRDFELFVKRDRFTGMDISKHDNLPLNEVLSRGMSDNHFHLRASAPYFTLSWISLMNSVTCNQVSVQLDKINEQPRNPQVRYRYQYEEDKFVILHLKAAAIRAYLYASLTDQMVEFGEYAVSIEWLLDFILEREPLEKLLYERDVQMCKYESIQQFWEAQEGGAENIKENYAGFYWLFWDCFPFIPLHCLEDNKNILCRENRRYIAAYIKRSYEPLPFSQCAWLFRGHDQKIFYREWERQTKQALKDMLKDPYKIEIARYNIQYVIDGFQTNHRSWHKNKDYVLNSMKYDGGAWEQAVISGELWLFYEMERRRYFCSDKAEMQDNWKYQLLFAYLSIKEAFRSEMLQNNEKIGFQNFHAYQKRKDWFTSAFSEGELAQIAVKRAFFGQNLNSLELRIMPRNTDIENIQMLLGYDKAIGMCSKQDMHKNRYYYVFHFGKRQDLDKMFQEKELCCRHAVYRDDLRHKAQAIMSMRERNPEIGCRLKGIDACSSEDGCRPEVFSVAFRVLRSHIVYQEEGYRRLPQLRISYHVGESNQDVLDGLRAIDEAIYFLQMESGDRLGHATMLGVDAEKWYAKNDYKISIRKHDYLDNITWLYHQIIHYHVSNQDNLLEYLEHEFQKYFNCVYERCMRDAYNDLILSEKYSCEKGGVSQRERKFRTLDYNIHNYYYAWELRGDDPQLYREGYYKNTRVSGSLWEDQKINRLVDLDNRNIDEVAILYHAYHYNEAVRREGNASVVVKIPYYMVRGIAKVQKKLQMKIAKKGIAIETNPTSNLKIAGLEGYESHPITSFYNKGLTLDGEKIGDCPQISVSINTDDPGVFITSLYNEYTMIAGALEHIKTQDGVNVYKKDMVYDWIDCIRKMGNSQSFGGELEEKDGGI